MLTRIICFVLFAVLVGGVFGQCDSLNMRLVGSWECPSDDLYGYNGVIGKIGNYVILAVTRRMTGHEQPDSLWIIDVSTPSSPDTAIIYADTAFSDTPAVIRWFTFKEESEDSGYIYVGYNGGGREYFRVLKLKDGNPPTLTKMGIVDSIYRGMFATRMGYWVYGGGTFHVDDPGDPVWVTSTVIYEGYLFPPDASSDIGDWEMTDIYSDQDYMAISGWIWDSAEVYEPAAYLRLSKRKHPDDSDIDTSWIKGCWRGAYNGNGGYCVALNETLRVVAIDMGPGEGLAFVSMDSIEDSAYTAEPLAELGLPPWDMHWIDGYLYLTTGGYTYVLDVTNVSSGTIVTIGMYHLGTGTRILADSCFIYLHSMTGYLYILELDTTMQVGEDGCSFLDEEFRIFPNPILQNQRLVLDKKLKKPKLFDISGRKIELHDRTINTSELSPGIYLLVADLNNKKIIKKLVVLG